VAIEIGAAYLSILPSTDKIAPGVKDALGDVEDEAGQAGDRSGQKFGSSFKAKIGSALKGGLLAGVAGVGALGAMGVKTAAEMEQAEIAFTTMLGSGEKAQAFIADLTDFAAKTPFEFPGLQTAATSLISAGIATKDVLPIMTTLGDVTSGMGTGSEGIQRATVALQQMNAAGKVTGEDLNQLRDAGIPVFDLLSASMGKTKEEIAAMAQAGTLGKEGLDAIMSGLKTGTGLERFSGLMEKQSQSLTGMWSTFKDTLQMGMADAVKPLIPMLKDGLAGAAKALPPIIAGVATALQKVIQATIGIVQWGQRHKTLVTVLGTAVAALVAGMVAYSVTMRVITAVTRGWAIAQALLNAAMALNPVGLVIAAVVALGVVLFVAWKKSETFRNIVTGAFDKVKAAGRAVADFFTQSVPAAFGKVKSAASSALGWVKANWPKILAVLTGPFGLAVYAIAKNWGKIKAGAGAAKDWIVDKWNALIGFFKSLPSKVTSATAGLWNGIRDSFRGVINDVIGWWNGLTLHLDIPDKIPGLPDSFSISTPNIPYLAKGGLLMGPTLNVAGEAGPEAVVPLDRLEGWVSKAASIGAANADGRGYASASGSGVSGRASRTEFVITNWHTGEGYFREIAEDTYAGEDAFAGTTRRMR